MNKVPDLVKQELSVLAGISEEQIDYSDIPATTESDWEGAERGKFYRPVKMQMTARIDADVLAWLKSQGKGYQGRMNAILREAMLRDFKGEQQQR